MHTNRRRHANVIPIASFATWALVAIFVLGGGLAWVWCKNQLYSNGTEIRSLERELAELKDRNEAAVTKIAQLSSIAKLRERQANNEIKLIPITNDRVVVVSNMPASPAGELQPVSNERKHE